MHQTFTDQDGDKLSVSTEPPLDFAYLTIIDRNDGRLGFELSPSQARELIIQLSEWVGDRA